MDVLVVGSVALDTVHAPTGSRERILGGSASFFSTAASLFAPVRLVAVVGADFPEEHVEFLRDRGVDLDGLERVAGGETFFWAGRYAPDFSTRTSIETRLGVFAGFRPRLPAAFRDAGIVFLGNIDPALQLEVLDQVRTPGLVVCDTMNFWIEGKPEELRRVLGRADVLLVNDEEARQLSGRSALVHAAREIQAMGPKGVVIKRGDAGALLFHDDRVFACPAFPLERVVDPTGAGDTFAGGFCGHLATAGDVDGRSIRRAMAVGTVLASYCVEDFSLDRLRALRLPEVHARYRALRELTQFDEL